MAHCRTVPTGAVSAMPPSTYRPMCARPWGGAARSSYAVTTATTIGIQTRNRKAMTTRRSRPLSAAPTPNTAIKSRHPARRHEMDPRAARSAFEAEVHRNRDAAIALCAQLVHVDSANPPGDTGPIATLIERYLSEDPAITVRRVVARAPV